MTSVLIVDDDTVFCEVLASSLTRRGWHPHTAHCSDTARASFHTAPTEHVVLDLKIAAENGLRLIPEFCRVRPTVKIVVLTGYASIATAVEAIKLGAHHYLTKPTDVNALLAAFAHQAGFAPPVFEHPPTPLERIEWEAISRAMLEANNNISVAATRLGLHRRTLQRKLKKRPAGMD